MEEIWKDCKDLKYYQVSNKGNIRSKDKEVNSKGGSIAIKRGKILSPANFNNYLGIKVSDKGKTQTKLIHILVAEIFVENINNKPCVNHKDGNKHNNLYTNLEWVSYSENMQHASDNNLTKTGEKHYNSKLSDKDVLDIKEKYKTGKYTHASLGKEYGVTKQNITMIINNKSRKK